MNCQHFRDENGQLFVCNSRPVRWTTKAWCELLIAKAKEMYPYVWFWRSRLPDRKGQRCRVLVRAKSMNSIAVEFEDGYRVVTSRYAVRKAK